MTKKMKQKVHVRDSIVDFVQRVERFLRKFDPATHVLQVQSRLEKLDDKWTEFEDIQAQIEEMEEHEENVAVHRNIRAEFEELYFRVRAELKAKLPSETSHPSSPSAPANSSVSASPSIQLPKITLPEFKGEFDQWLPFHDTFKSLIHENPSLVAIQKFHYLRASLKGEALKVIDAFTLSEASYGVAWSALVKRYANPYLQKKRHVNALLQYQRLKKPTAGGIHGIIDCFDRHTKILDQLGENTSGWGAMLTQLLVSKLDDSIQRDWEEYALKKENPNFAHLMEFLEGQTRILDAVAADQFSGDQCSSSTSSSSTTIASKKLSLNSASEDTTPECLACGGSHYISSCSNFEELSLDKRFDVVNGKRLCSNCLRRDHINRECSSRGRCRTCSKKHHSLLHPGYAASGSGSAVAGQDSEELQTGSSSIQATTTVTSPVLESSQQNTVASIHAANAVTKDYKTHVFLSTVLLTMKDRNGRSHTVRALLDSGSQANLISERLCQLLKLSRKRINVPIAGIGNALHQVDHMATATVSSRISDYSVPMEFLILKKVANDTPSITVPISSVNLPTDMRLADPDFNKRAPIDMLLGLEHFYEFLLVNDGRIHIKRVDKHLPLFVNTVFGWIAAGAADLGTLHPIQSCHMSIQISHNRMVAPNEQRRDSSIRASSFPKAAECGAACFQEQLNFRHHFNESMRSRLQLEGLLDKEKLLGMQLGTSRIGCNSLISTSYYMRNARRGQWRHIPSNPTIGLPKIHQLGGRQSCNYSNAVSFHKRTAQATTRNIRNSATVLPQRNIPLFPISPERYPLQVQLPNAYSL